MKNIVISRNVEESSYASYISNFELKVTGTGLVTAYTSETDDKSFLNLFRMAYVIHGDNAIVYDDKTRVMIPNNTAVYLPYGHELIIETKDDSEPVQEYFINFDIRNISKHNEFHKLMETSLPNNMVQDYSEKIKSFFQRILIEATDKNYGYDLSIQNLFIGMITMMFRIQKMTNLNTETVNRVLTTSSTPLIKLSLEYISQNIKKGVKVNEIADYLGISEIYLYKLFVNEYNKSPQKFINDYRLDLAKKYLSNPSYSIKTIADELGYCCSNHFSKSFKNQTGYSPNQYRGLVINK